MKRSTMWMASVAVLMLAMAGVMTAQDRDGDRDDWNGRGNAAQAHDRGYQQGYTDGARHGREERRENDASDFRTEEFQRADHGYAPWMGPLGQFQSGYRDGYRNGYNSVFGNNGWRGENGEWQDGDERGYVPYRKVGIPARSPAYSYGYRDGSEVARQDMADGKRYNPNPRGRYEAEDNGYRGDYGSKDAYRAEYAQAYRSGYESTFQGFGNRY
jgi:hypothetical protein